MHLSQPNTIDVRENRVKSEPFEFQTNSPIEYQEVQALRAQVREL